MRILVVDDDEISRTVLEHALELGGYEVEQAKSGEDALEILRERPCRLVISDWEMPGMDGTELCRHIRREEFPGYVYVILLTGRDRTADVVEGLSAGADDFVTKPIDPNVLRVRVRSAERVLALETRDVAIFALAKLAESREPETGAHLERVRTYSRLLARRLASHPELGAEIDAEFVRLIYLTSPLHDIGKVAIPDRVLLKAGRLSETEFEIMKSHTIIGAQTLGAALRQFPGVRFLSMARDIALSHHEHYDGTGYPKGLKGREIPLSGRIVAVADVYDALVSKRVYKNAFAHDVARRAIVRESGRHFDPAVVEAFLADEEQFAALSRQHREDRLTPAPGEAVRRS